MKIMTRQERLKICKTCKNRKRDMERGLICAITNDIAVFETKCNDFIIDEDVAKKEKIKELNRGDIEKGKKKTVTIYFLLIGLSLFIAFVSHLTFKPLSENEIIKEVFRLGIEIGLLAAIYKGHNWAKVIITILFLLGIILGIVPMITLISKTYLGWFMVILLGIYGYALYFFNGDKDFLEFFKHQKENR